MRTPGRSQQGFTLVELMISMVLGLFIILALLTMLVNTSRTNTEMSTVNRVIENGRFAVQLLATDVSHAGYWGGHVPEFDSLIVTTVPADEPTAVPNPCLAFASWDATVKNNMVGIAVQGTDIPDPVPSPTSPFCAGVITNPQPSTDVLVVRHLEPCLVGSGTDDCSDTRAAPSPHLYLQPSRCSTDASTYVLNTSTFTLKAGNCVDDAPIRRFASSIYYVRNWANSAGDGIPTLVRSRFGVSDTGSAGNDPAFRAAQALVEGVEGFRVEYGIDNKSDTGDTVTLAKLGDEAPCWSASPSSTTCMTVPLPSVLNTAVNRGNGLPDTYIRCSQGTPCTAEQLVNVTTVKLYVLVRGERTSTAHNDTKKYCLASTCASAADYMGPFNDGFKRHLFTQTIRLTNVAMRRETS